MSVRHHLPSKRCPRLLYARHVAKLTRHQSSRAHTMPELPDITIYIEALRRRVIGETMTEVRLGTPFLLRTVEPPLSELVDQRVTDVRRSGKRIVLALEHELFVVLHLMIAG